MIKLDHLNISISNYPNSRDWYVRHVGLKVEFENVAAGVGGLSGDGDVELILTQGKLPSGERDCALTFQCDSVHGKYDELSALGLSFVHPPMSVVWGYGAELRDPDGYAVRFWDKTTMPGYKENK
ncbi:MAG TPA: VOC family protein [Terracidiphilus sp.]|nr:VOC family protein [Terracidiphilus sp.]